MIKGQIKLQNRRPRIFAVRIVFDHRPQCLKCLERQALITTHFVDLIVVGQGQQILRIGRVTVRRVEVQEPLCRSTAVFVIFVTVIGEGLHDQRAFRPFRIGIKAFDLTEIERGIRLATAFEFVFTALINFFGRKLLKRPFDFGVKGITGRQRGDRQERDRQDGSCFCGPTTA